MKSHPFFSIGVTTYNRSELLKQCLRSIMAQTYTDFEVIIGNNYTVAEVTGETLEINDKRIRYINHDSDLGQVGNMNKLLELCKGKYFTWLQDDDLYMPSYLNSIYNCIMETEYPKCVYTSFKIHLGISEPKADTDVGYNAGYALLSGREFVCNSVQNNIRAIGSMGMFEREYLRSLCGYPDITKYDSSPYSAYGEYWLLVRAGLLSKVPYISTPLLYFRHHATSWSQDNTVLSNNVDQLKYRRQAGHNLVKKCAAILIQPPLIQDFEENIQAVMEISLGGLAHTSNLYDHSSKLSVFRELYSAKYHRLFDDDPELLKLARKSYRKALINIYSEYLWPITISILKERTPSFLIRFYRYMRKKS